MLRLVKRERGDLKPSAGDTIVTLRVDPGQSLEERIHLLGTAFVRVVQGSSLKQVLEYDLNAGVVRFVLSGSSCEPRDLDGWPMVCSATRIVGPAP